MDGYNRTDPNPIGWVDPTEFINDHRTFSGPDNNHPTIIIADQTVTTKSWALVSNWISYSDPDGDVPVQYQFWDEGTGSASAYFWTPDNAHNQANSAITVSAADIDNVWIQGGQSAGSETMWVRAFDGTDWSEWDSFTLTTVGNTPPIATVSNHNVQKGQWASVNSWVSYSDVDGDVATMYQFRDGGPVASSAYFWTPENPHHRAGTTITVSADELSDVWIRGGRQTGNETMYVRAFDGTAWSSWDSFTVTTTSTSTSRSSTQTSSSDLIASSTLLANYIAAFGTDNTAYGDATAIDPAAAASSTQVAQLANPHHT